MTEQNTKSTFIESLRDSLLSATHYNDGDSVAPAVVLWTDADGEWMPLIPQLKTLMPELLILGEYNPEQKTGPAIWIRCMIERTLPENKLPENTVPIAYMPKISRQTLRSPEDCPELLRPLVELQYRGTVWTQTNGRDWTVEAFLMSESGGLGLDLSRDQKTRQSILGSLGALATTSVSSLRGRKLEAEDFDKLMIGDTARDILLWLGDPAGTRKQWDEAYWKAFCSRCQDEYGFSPEYDGEIVAAEKLGLHQDKWVGVWNRFAESPLLFSGVPDALRRAKPSTLLFVRESWPDENEMDENELRKEFLSLKSVSPPESRKKILKLDEKHGERRSWVWLRMGQSPLAAALEHLGKLAEKTAKTLGGDAPEIFADNYSKDGWIADDSALRAIASVKSAGDQEAVNTAVRAIYLQWLDDSARNFQKVLEKKPLPDYKAIGDSLVKAQSGECILFVDGLRFDIAQRLMAKAHERKIQCSESHRWSALPTVTPTAKPAVSPVASLLSDGNAGKDFTPVVTSTQKTANADRLLELLMDSGYQILNGLETGNPHIDDAKSWTECGEFDKHGHSLQAKLAAGIDGQLELVMERITSLLEAGWKSVRVITDHGWLLVPGQLPSIQLPKYLVECRWARCAVIKEGAKADVPVMSWFWDNRQIFAFAPGANCFGKGNEYAHGGISVQECLIPDLTFRSDSAGKSEKISIEPIQWLGLRCRVVITPPSEGLSADLRTKPNDPGTSVAKPKGFDSEGRAGLLVENENLAGTAVNLVILNSNNQIIAREPTTVGGDT